MGSIKKLLQIIILALPLLFAACQYNKFDEPKEKEQLPLPAATHTIAEVRTFYREGKGGNLIPGDVIIRGVVASEDTKGNFYRSIHIQDTTGGIELKMGMVNMSLFYKQGQEVALCCQGLAVGKYGDVISIGYPSNDPAYETSFVPDLMVPRVLLAGRFVGITPIELTIDRITPRYSSMLVTVKDVQFLESELSQTYANPEQKESVGAVNHTLIDKAGRQLLVRTSSYATFAGKKLPQGSGSVTALLTFFRDTPQLIIIDNDRDVQLNNPRF